MESIINLMPGPGSFWRSSGVPAATLALVGGKSWREVLVDGSHGRLVWIGVQNHSRALMGAHFDSGTRRTGRVIHAVAKRRMESLGEFPTDEITREAMRSERKSLMQKAYMPQFIVGVLG